MHTKKCEEKDFLEKLQKQLKHSNAIHTNCTRQNKVGGLSKWQVLKDYTRKFFESVISMFLIQRLLKHAEARSIFILTRSGVQCYKIETTFY